MTVPGTGTGTGSIYLKVPKCEIFDRSDFQDFYTIKSLREGDLVVKIKKFLNKNQGFIWGRKIPYAYAQSDFQERSHFKTCWAYASGTDAYPERAGQELRIRN